MKPAPDGGVVVDMRMTMTAPGCGMGGVLMADVESKLRALPGIKDVKVELVWDPPWDRDRMSEAARLQLGMM
jgi:metal-sulfur cluster biosynthetic enzyme